MTLNTSKWSPGFLRQNKSIQVLKAARSNFSRKNIVLIDQTPLVARVLYLALVYTLF